MIKSQVKIAQSKQFAFVNEKLSRHEDTILSAPTILGISSLNRNPSSLQKSEVTLAYLSPPFLKKFLKVSASLLCLSYSFVDGLFFRLTSQSLRSTWPFTLLERFL